MCAVGSIGSVALARPWGCCQPARCTNGGEDAAGTPAGMLLPPVLGISAWILQLCARSRTEYKAVCAAQRRCSDNTNALNALIVSENRIFY